MQNQFSREFEISNQVYQGTVLGPPMWNNFFADVAPVASANAFIEAMFANDLNVCKMFNKYVTNTYVYDQLGQCQQRVHKWGQVCRVDFGPAKEEF